MPECETTFGNPDWADNWTRGTGLRLEIIDVATSDVWLCQDQVDQERARSLTPPSGFRVSGAAAAVCDDAWFARSPDERALLDEAAA